MIWTYLFIEFIKSFWLIIIIEFKSDQLNKNPVYFEWDEFKLECFVYH